MLALPSIIYGGRSSAWFEVVSHARKIDLVENKVVKIGSLWSNCVYHLEFTHAGLCSASLQNNSRVLKLYLMYQL